VEHVDRERVLCQELGETVVNIQVLAKESDQSQGEADGHERFPKSVREALPVETAVEESPSSCCPAANHDQEPERKANGKHDREPGGSLLLREVFQLLPFSRMEAKKEKRDVCGEIAKLEVGKVCPDGLEQPDGERSQPGCHDDEDHGHDAGRGADGL